MSDDFTPESSKKPTEEPLVLPEVMLVPEVETSPAAEEPAPELTPAADAEPAAAPAAEVVAPDAEPAAAAPAEPAAAEPAEPVAEPAEPVAEAAAAPEIAPLTPGPGPMLTAGSRVVLVVSSGPAAVAPTVFVEMPDLVGERQGDALSALQDSELSVQVFNDYSLTVERGRVMAQRPTLGANVPVGSEVVLLVSSGAAASQTHNVPLPRVTGLSEGEAVTKLQAGGLSPQVVRTPDPLVPADIVVAQLPDEISLAALPTKRRPATWIWLVTAAVLLAAIAGAFLYYQSQPIIVPNVVGLSAEQAQDAIQAAGFKVGSITTTQTLSASEIGNVVTQTPEPNREAKKGSDVSISVSGGQALFPVPDVTGKAQADAEKILKDAGFQVSVQQGFDATVTAGSVISQSPAKDEKVPVNTTVGIVVSKGAENVIVPGLIGQAQATAIDALKSLGLGSQVVMSSSTTVSKGYVINQSPISGTSTAPKTIVGLLVSSGPLASGTSTTTVPSVVGKSLTDAQKALKNANLVAVTILRSGTGKANNIVVAQLPDPGVVVGRKSSILLIVSNGK